MSTLYGWKRYANKTESYPYYVAVYSPPGIDRGITQINTSKKYYSGLRINQSSGRAEGTGSAIDGGDAKSQGLNLTGRYELWHSWDTLKHNANGYSKVTSHTAGSNNFNYEYYKIEKETRTRDVRGAYVDIVTSTNRNAYPNDGVSGSYWYVYDGIQNRPPQIGGEDLFLGIKTDDFVISYSVTDADGDAVTVTIMVDGVTKVNAQAVTLGRSYDFPIALADFSLGQHTVRITASDGTSTSTRIYIFNKSNTAPTISGEDRDLGGKSTAFTLDFIVTDENDDDVTVSVLLDGTEIQRVTGAQDQTLSTTITNEQLAAMEVDSTHTITIRADDSKGGIAYRRYTFTKTNRPPIISGSDTDWGELEDPKRLILSITDVEMDQITYKILLDGKAVREAQEAEDNVDILYDIPPERWLPLDYGSHVLEIRAWDEFSVNTPSVRRITFTRIPSGLEAFVKINEFDIKPTKLIAVPHGTFAEDAEITVMVCNNYLDANPTWEDASAMSRIARAYTFENDTKTAGKWAIGIHITIQNGESGAPSVLRGLKGGYE